MASAAGIERLNDDSAQPTLAWLRDVVAAQGLSDTIVLLDPERLFAPVFDAAALERCVGRRDPDLDAEEAEILAVHEQMSRSLPPRMRDLLHENDALEQVLKGPVGLRVSAYEWGRSETRDELVVPWLPGETARRAWASLSGLASHLFPPRNFPGPLQRERMQAARAVGRMIASTRPALTAGSDIMQAQRTELFAWAFAALALTGTRGAAHALSWYVAAADASLLTGPVVAPVGDVLLRARNLSRRDGGTGDDLVARAERLALDATLGEDDLFDLVTRRDVVYSVCGQAGGFDVDDDGRLAPHHQAVAVVAMTAAVNNPGIRMGRWRTLFARGLDGIAAWSFSPGELGDAGVREEAAAIYASDLQRLADYCAERPAARARMLALESRARFEDGLAEGQATPWSDRRTAVLKTLYETGNLAPDEGARQVGRPAYVTLARAAGYARLGRCLALPAAERVARLRALIDERPRGVVTLGHPGELAFAIRCDLAGAWPLVRDGGDEALRRAVEELARPGPRLENAPPPGASAAVIALPLRRPHHDGQAPTPG